MTEQHGRKNSGRVGKPGKGPAKHNLEPKGTKPLTDQQINSLLAGVSEILTRFSLDARKGGDNSIATSSASKFVRTGVLPFSEQETMVNTGMIHVEAEGTEGATFVTPQFTSQRKSAHFW